MTRGFLRFVRGNTIAMLALFVALGGTTYAATALPKNSVGTKQLKKNAVTPVKIKKSAVTNPKIANNAVTSAKTKNDSLTGADVLESSLGAVPNANALGGVVASGYLKSGAAAGGGLAGTYPNPTLAANSVGASQVADGSLNARDAASVTGSFVLNPGSIAANSCTTEFPTPPGVLTTDVIVVTPPNQMASYPVSVFAIGPASNNFIRLRFCNVSAAASDPASMTFQFVAFHT